VDPLQQHHELGRSVTNEGGVRRSAVPTHRRDGWREDRISASWSISHLNRGYRAGDRDVCYCSTKFRSAVKQRDMPTGNIAGLS
jgi:hypothetical protein